MSTEKSEGVDREDASLLLGLSTAKSTAPVTVAPKVLSADAYDTLEFATLESGGIGIRQMFEGGADDALPVCLLGHAGFVQNTRWVIETLLWKKLVRAGLNTSVSDYAVKDINRRKGTALNRRVSWGEYTSELNIVRGA